MARPSAGEGGRQFPAFFSPLGEGALLVFSFCLRTPFSQGDCASIFQLARRAVLTLQRFLLIGALSLPGHVFCGRDFFPRKQAANFGEPRGRFLVILGMGQNARAILDQRGFPVVGTSSTLSARNPAQSALSNFNFAGPWGCFPFRLERNPRGTSSNWRGQRPMSVHGK